MKWIFALFVIPLVASAQNKISGLGPFKIGQTLSSKIASFADTSAGRLYYAQPEDSLTERWAAGYYQIAGMWIEDLDLRFYKDTLYFIECKFSDSLRMAISAKYGDGVVTIKHNSVKCRTGLKISYDEQEKTYFTHYPTTSKNISAWAIVGNWFNDECKEEYRSNYFIVNERTEQKINAINDARTKKEEKDKQTALKSKLGDF